MRRFAIVISSAILCLSATASDFGWGSGHLFSINKGTSTSLFANSDSSLYIVQISGDSNVKFGFYSYDLNSNSIVSSYDSAAKFSKNELLGIWMEKDGKTLYSTHTLNAHNLTYDGWKVDGDNFIFGFETGGSHYVGYDKLDVMFQISTTAPLPPSGQPLPGVLGTIFVSIPMLGYIAYRYKRK